MKTIVKFNGQKDTIQGECSAREAMEILGLNPKEWKTTEKAVTEKAVTYTLERVRSLALVPVGQSVPEPDEPVIEEAVTEEAVTQELDVATTDVPEIPSGQITVDREELEAVLQVVCDITAKKDLMPVLGTVKVEASPENLTVTATDLEVSYLATIPAVLEKNDATAFLVDAGILYKEVKALNKSIEDVVITVKGDSIHINDRCNLPATLTDDFPGIETIDGARVSISGLKSALACVLPAVSTDEARYILTGVCFDLAAGCLIGTDGFRLHRATVEKADIGQFVVPRRAAAILAKYGAENLTVADIHIAASLVGGIFTSRLIKGNYPDHVSVWPDTAQYNKVHFKAKEFLGLLPGVLPVSDSAKIEMTINGRIDIKAESATGSYSWYVPADSTLVGETKTISINSRYIVDAIRAYASSEEIEIAFPPGYAAIVLNEQALIMPIRQQ